MSTRCDSPVCRNEPNTFDSLETVAMKCMMMLNVGECFVDVRVFPLSSSAAEKVKPVTTEVDVVMK